ncbi:hypothetical protein Tco_1511210 [Tanacetum coccineum]
MFSRGWAREKRAYSHVSNLKTCLAVGTRMPGETQVLGEPPDTWTAEKERQETLSEAMSHAPAKDIEKLKENGTWLIRETIENPNRMRKDNSVKVKTMEEATKNLSQESQNPPLMRRAFLNLGYAKRLTHSLYGSVTLNFPSGFACRVT